MGNGTAKARSANTTHQAHRAVTKADGCREQDLLNGAQSTQGLV